MSAPTNEQIDAFAAALEAKLRDAHATAGDTGTDTLRIVIERGKRYARIVEQRRADCRSAYGFIDLTNGDLLKSDGWKAPAKHRRGSLHNANPLAGCGLYGMAYLR